LIDKWRSVDRYSDGDGWLAVSRVLSQFVQGQFDQFVKHGDVAFPASGETWSRFAALAHLSSLDLSLGRLCEGHSDALAILSEAGMKPVDSSASYGVWAARGSRAQTKAERVAKGWRLTGTKEFCSGSGTLDRALVAAETPDGYLLFDIDVNQNVESVDHESWPALGMADSMSLTLTFDGPVIEDDRVVGFANFYTQRPGFWHGAAGVAACWFGGASALVNDLIDSIGKEANEHVLADVGIATSALESMRSVLKSVAQDIDDDPFDEGRQAQFRALVARQVVHDSTSEILARVAGAGGARPLCHDEVQARRAADLYVYLAQHHGGADAAALGRIKVGRRS
jgi:alkylation response protein AidB-like acyl-CoA dehydrogenase